MFISQHRIQFSSLEEAQTKIDEGGRRVVIGNGEEVVTIRPQIVKSFPGTIEQLFEIGKKLGSYPIDIFKLKKRELELQDHSKEIAFSRTIGHMIFLSEQRANSFVREMFEFLRSLIERLNLKELVLGHKEVSDFLLSFRTDVNRNGMTVSITGMEACEGYLDELVIRKFGEEIIQYLKEHVEDHLRNWINDSFSVFSSQYSEDLSADHLYKILLEHPDILLQHEEIKSKIRSEFYNSNPNLIIETDLLKDNDTTSDLDLGYPSESWDTKGLFEVIIKDQIHKILTTYFSLKNSCQVIQELTTFRSMVKLFLRDHRETIDAKSVEHLEELLTQWNKREYEVISKANPQSVHAHYLKQFKIEQLSSDFFNTEGDQFVEQSGSEQAKEWFINNILSRKELTWEEKGILSFTFFLGSGFLNFDELMKFSNTPRSMLRKTVQRLEEKEVLLTCDDSGSLHIKWISDLDWKHGIDLLSQLPLMSFESFIKDDELSWDAKGIYTWIKCNDLSLYEIDTLTSLSSTPIQLVELAFHELIEEGYIVHTVSGLELHPSDHNRVKESLLEWYQCELRPALQALLSLPGEKSHILNAKYPTKFGYTAIQIASIIDDVAMVEALLRNDHIIMLDSNDLMQHPLLLAYNSESHSATEKLLEDRRVIEHDELINIFFGKAIMEEIPAGQLSKYLHKLCIPDKREVVSKFLLPALMRKNEEAIHALLQAGASPNTIIVQQKTAMDIAKEREEIDIILLFKQYS